MKCKKCNAEMDFIQGENILDTRLEQYHCPKCHWTCVFNYITGSIREGILPDRR